MFAVRVTALRTVSASAPLLRRPLALPGGGAVLPLSTGVIGWRLPVDKMIEGLPKAVEDLKVGSALPAAQSNEPGYGDDASVRADRCLSAA